MIFNYNYLYLLYFFKKIAIIIVNAEDPLQKNPIVIFAHGNG